MCQSFLSPWSQFPLNCSLVGTQRTKSFPCTAEHSSITKSPNFLLFIPPGPHTPGQARKGGVLIEGCVCWGGRRGESWHEWSDSCAWPMAYCEPHLEGTFLLGLLLRILRLLQAPMLPSPLVARWPQTSSPEVPVAQDFHTPAPIQRLSRARCQTVLWLSCFPPKCECWVSLIKILPGCSLGTLRNLLWQNFRHCDNNGRRSF